LTQLPECHKEVAVKRLIIEMGMGVDPHGQEPTIAARAGNNAIAPTFARCLEVAGMRSRSND